MMAPRPLPVLSTRLLAGPAVALALAAALLPAGPARADMPGLALGQGDIFTDAVGSVIGVSITNNGAAAVGSAVVTCAFTAGGKPAGSASTNLYNILPGQKGQDQVHMMGVKADKASCAITASTPSSN